MRTEMEIGNLGNGPHDLFYGPAEERFRQIRVT
jgi:hypothetical protein